MKGFILGLFSLAVFFLPFLVQGAQAADEFTTTYDVVYEVGSDGITSVTQKISLKNLTSKYYASNFTLTIGSTTVADIQASDESGTMETQVENKEGKTSITATFNQQIAGTGKLQTFTLKFKSSDFAQVLGKTWEVNLPKIPESSNIESYNATLSVPLEFGDPTSISPTPKSQSQTFDRLFFTFNKEQLKGHGISVNFGSFQIFDFNLKYNLENNSLFPVSTSIALPPDTAYQDVLISRIDPAPSNVTIDEDGNYLAWFKLPRRSKQQVLVSGSAKLYISSKDKNPRSLSENQLREWTKSDQYWEKDNPAVAATLAEIFKEGMPKTKREKARLIFQYVVSTLKYDTSRLNNANIERLGAVTALNNPKSAVCMEFTDLFIALSRATGVPSRELDGFAYSRNRTLRPLSLSPDLLHAWPEYFDDEKGWVMVDPTWENTSGGVDYFNKFDLNHLVLAIKGVSSRFPYTSDDVRAEVSQVDFLGKPQIDLTAEIPDSIWAGFPATVSVKVVNKGNFVQGPSTLALNSGQTTVLGDKSLNLGPIPPFGFATYQFNLRTPFVWQGFEDVIAVQAAGQKITKNVLVRPFFLFQPFPYLLIILIGLTIIIYGSILGLHIYKKRAVRGK